MVLVTCKVSPILWWYQNVFLWFWSCFNVKHLFCQHFVTPFIICVLYFGVVAFHFLLSQKIKGTNGQVTRADILQVGLRELLNALFSNPMDDNLICAVKLLKVGFTYFLALKCNNSTLLVYNLEKSTYSTQMNFKIKLLL